MFQAFFITYLVEPGYEEPIETMSDIERAGLKYSTFEAIDSLFEVIDFNDFQNFTTKLFLGFAECVRSVIFGRDAFTFGMTFFPKYLARVEGFQDESKVICFAEESLVTLALGAGLPLGSPLLNILNVHITRCVEGGLLESYWSKLTHEVNLKAAHIVENDFMVFTLNHLSPVFISLLFGYIISVIIFVFELIHFNVNNRRRHSSVG